MSELRIDDCRGKLGTPGKVLAYRGLSVGMGDSEAEAIAALERAERRLAARPVVCDSRVGVPNGDDSMTILKAPYPYFGGKSKVAPVVWQYLGDVPNFIDPFYGSGAILLSRPHAPQLETVNDIDGMISNFWRAVQHAPDEVAKYADWPVNEIDLHARHRWLRSSRERVEAMMHDPDLYDAKVAGWWVWGISQWIGSGWCCPISVPQERKLCHLGNAGMGIHRKRPAIGGRGDRPSSVGSVHAQSDIYAYFDALSARLRRVRVVCGDWSRVVTPSVTTGHGLTGVFLDPPYRFEDRDSDLYACDNDVFNEVREWAIANGDNPLLRIAICGYNFDMPDGWMPYRWKTTGGYGSQGNGRGKVNAGREVVWFSPRCIGINDLPLFAQTCEAT